MSSNNFENENHTAKADCIIDSELFDLQGNESGRCQKMNIDFTIMRGMDDLVTELQIACENSRFLINDIIEHYDPRYIKNGWSLASVLLGRLDLKNEEHKKFMDWAAAAPNIGHALDISLDYIDKVDNLLDKMNELVSKAYKSHKEENLKAIPA